jgi:hypothetical protein
MEDKKTNPANAPEKKLSNKTRIPMSVPQLKLSAPDIPGFHTHWMLGTAARLAQARRAGYTFVEEDEIDLNNFDLAGDPEDTGNTDLGSRVSIVAGQGGDSDADKALRLYLMKLPLEFWEEDQKLIGDRNEQIAAGLRGDSRIESGYIPESHKKSVAELFRRKN